MTDPAVRLPFLVLDSKVLNMRITAANRGSSLYSILGGGSFALYSHGGPLTRRCLSAVTGQILYDHAVCLAFVITGFTWVGLGLG